MRVLRDGFRIVREVVRQKPLDAFRGEELSPGPGCTSDADVDAHIRMTATTVQHASCTCRIGRDESAVVDAQLRVRGRTVGVMSVGTIVDRLFSASDLLFMAAVADQVAIAIDRARQFASEARTDHLTGLANRREFERVMEREVALAERHNRRL